MTPATLTQHNLLSRGSALALAAAAAAWSGQTAAADRIGLPAASGAVTIDGVAGAAEWGNAFQYYLEDGASVAAAFMRGMADANFVYLYFEAEDVDFEEHDAVMLVFNPTNAAGNYKRLIVNPCSGACPGTNLTPQTQWTTGSIAGANVTWGAPSALPAGIEVKSSAVSDGGLGGRFGVEVKIAKANFPFLAMDFFQMFADVIATDGPNGTAVQYSWPAGATIGADENDVFFGSLDTAPVPVARFGEATLNAASFPAGLQITGFGNSGADPTRISLSGPNSFYVTAANSPGAVGPVADATGVTATFMINNIGLNPSWTWTNVPVGNNPTAAQTIAARQYMALHANPWTLSNADNWQGSGMSGVAFFTANPHQCIRVDLNHSGGSTITRQWNMTFVSVNSPFEVQPQIATGAWRKAFPKARAVMLREVFLNAPRNLKWKSSFAGAKAAGENRWIVEDMNRSAVRLKTSVLAPAELQLPGRQYRLDPATLSRGRFTDVAVTPGTVVTLLPDGYATRQRLPFALSGGGSLLARDSRARPQRFVDAFRGRAAIQPGALIGSFDGFRTSFAIGTGTTVLVPDSARKLQVRFADGAPYDGGNVMLQAIPASPTAAAVDGLELARIRAKGLGAVLPLANHLPAHIVRGSVDTGTFVRIQGKKFRVAAPAGSYGAIVRSVRGLSGAPIDIRQLLERPDFLRRIDDRLQPRPRPRPERPR
jgi:hypothetical protein